MKKIPLISILVAACLICSQVTRSQDCDALIQQRAVPEGNAFIYATPYYTMHGQWGSATYNALTADSAVAIVFMISDPREKCVDERSNIHIRFTNGEDIAMTNAAGANCEGKVALFFSQGLGNMGLLDMFQTEKIRFIKAWLSNGRWVRIDFVDGMAYNLRRSMNCLVEHLGAPVTASPARMMHTMDPTDSVSALVKTSQPQFEGGRKALRVFFGRNMRRMSVVDRGVVIVSFVVDAEGNVLDPKVVSGVSEKIDEEARRLVSILPKWKPALKNGIPVSATVEVKIAF